MLSMVQQPCKSGSNRVLPPCAQLRYLQRPSATIAFGAQAHSKVHENAATSVYAGYRAILPCKPYKHCLCCFCSVLFGFDAAKLRCLMRQDLARRREHLPHSILHGLGELLAGAVIRQLCGAEGDSHHQSLRAQSAPDGGKQGIVTNVAGC